jgi:hypothetical protein
MKTKRSFSIVGVLLAAVVLGLGIANADIIPTNTIIGPLVAGQYTWTYDAQLSQGQNAFSGPPPTTNPVDNNKFVVGTFFTIYDFLGYVANSWTAPAGWTATVQNVGYTPSDVIPTDNVSISNITWTYGGAAALLFGPQDLGLFTAKSIYNQPTQVSFASRATSSQGPQITTIIDNVGQTQGPTGVPEPGMLMLLGCGLVGVAGVGRKLKK